MREIKFRGKRIYTGEWVYGFLVVIGKHHYIFTGIMDITGLFPTLIKFSVISETVRQYTGLDTMKNDVYETDIVEWYSNEREGTKRSGVVEFSDGAFVVKTQGITVSLAAVIRWGGEVIGNKFENPELLEVPKDA